MILIVWNIRSYTVFKEKGKENQQERQQDRKNSFDMTKTEHLPNVY